MGEVLLDVRLPGEPRGKGAGRAVRRGAHMGIATDAKTRQWMSEAVDRLEEAWSYGPLDRGVGVHIDCIKARPKRLLRKKDPDERMWCDGKPDADNVSKIVCDSLTDAGVLRDDAKVALLVVRTLYAARDEGPCTQIRVFDVPPFPTSQGDAH